MFPFLFFVPFLLSMLKGAATAGKFAGKALGGQALGDPTMFLKRREMNPYEGYGRAIAGTHALPPPEPSQAPITGQLESPEEQRRKRPVASWLPGLGETY